MVCWPNWTAQLLLGSKGLAFVAAHLRREPGESDPVRSNLAICKSPQSISREGVTDEQVD